MTPDEVITRIRARQEYLSAPTDDGHGHVVPRADGNRMRCGGPRRCVICQTEAEMYGRPAGADQILLDEIDRLRAKESSHQHDLARIAENQIETRGAFARLAELADQWDAEGWHDRATAVRRAMGRWAQ